MVARTRVPRRVSVLAVTGAMAFLPSAIGGASTYQSNSVTHATSVAWLAGWTNRAPVVVQNYGATNRFNYQVKIRLPTGFDYAKVQPSGTDIRITDRDGVTPLHYWIEQFNARAHSGTIWATVPAIAAGGSDTVYIYYGNPTATSQSNGSTTFPMFSNFNNPAWQTLPNPYPALSVEN